MASRHAAQAGGEPEHPRGAAQAGRALAAPQAHQGRRQPRPAQVHPRPVGAHHAALLV